MLSKQRWTVRTGGALALAGLMCFAGMDATAAAEPLRLAASHQQLATKSNPNGTATVTLAITLTNTGSVAAEDIRLVLLQGPGLPVMAGENVLAVGALAAGQRVTLRWPIKVLAPVAATRGGLPLIVIHAEGVAPTGAPVTTGVLSRAGNAPRAKAPSAGSASEPVAADAAVALRGSTERVSVDSAGNQTNGGGGFLAISATGRFVAFVSGADNLVAGDTNGTEDIFVHDRKTGVTERVSVDSAGNQANSYSVLPAISADGRFVAFYSDADNLVAGDTNRGIFVHDRKTGVTERVIGSSTFPFTISADGRFVAFTSEAGNPGDTNDTWDVFVHDRKTGVTEQVSVDSAGNQGNYASYGSTISARGRFVAFQSGADNLVPGDTNFTLDVFVHDRRTGATERVSVDSAGNQANNISGISGLPAISADGRFVAFESVADNLVAGDTNGVPNFYAGADVFVHDRRTGVTERVSVDSAGNQGNSISYGPTISADGRFVAFQSDADNLVPGDTNFTLDVFVHDRKTGATERVSVDSACNQSNQANNSSYRSTISADGRFVAFESDADNLVPGDTNGTTDVFVHDRKR